MRILSLLILIIICSSCNQPQNEIQEWRGTDRSGIYQVDNLSSEWPDQGPALIWSVEILGDGFGSPTFMDDQLWILGTQDSISFLYNFNVEGQFNGKYQIGKEWVVNFPGSRCAPTIVGTKIYAMTGMGDVVCFDSNDKSIDWKINMVHDFNGVVPRFGYSQSLVVEGDRVFCCPGGKTNNVIALNRLTGELIWSSKGMEERPAYNPAKVIEVGERKVFTTFSAYHFMGFDVENGDMLWKHEQINIPVKDRKPGMGDTHANTILYEDQVIYYFEGDGNCAVALEVSDNGNSITQLWNNAAIDNYMGGIVKFGNHIYSCGYSKKTLVKVDVSNGSVVDSIELGKGSLIAVNDKLIYYTERGEVHLVNTKKEKLEKISTFKIEKGSKHHFAHPAIHDGVLYVRHGEFLGAYKIINE